MARWAAYMFIHIHIFCQDDTAELRVPGEDKPAAFKFKILLKVNVIFTLHCFGKSSFLTICNRVRKIQLKIRASVILLNNLEDEQAFHHHRKVH